MGRKVRRFFLGACLFGASAITLIGAASVQADEAQEHEQYALLAPRRRRALA
jgi:hypothetical protein